ncbi:hypothetical protein [Streptomyces zagrosensis]|uniref:Integral membrane protein n=1 Tax=Streptomyces zagrosensis TaxID=1042984 RepID=A0A7W9QHP6_9ACTN|nr:hypothetical protein [Streptomyces zagrosensis]MBB5939447.1 hypothetical protein [Streptomyces zagrosensis]
MSDEQQPGADGPGPEADVAAGADAGPAPKPIRFFGTTWVHHDGGYTLRRIGFSLGTLLAAAAGALFLFFAYQGVAIAEVGELVNIMVVVALALCSAMAFGRTMEELGGSADRRRGGRGGRGRGDQAEDAAAEKSMRSIRLIGFVGVLLAYFCRSLFEAPREKRYRAEYEEAKARHERRRATRTGNPAAKRKKRKRD